MFDYRILSLSHSGPRRMDPRMYSVRSSAAPSRKLELSMRREKCGSTSAGWRRKGRSHTQNCRMREGGTGKKTTNSYLLARALVSFGSAFWSWIR